MKLMKFIVAALLALQVASSGGRLIHFRIPAPPIWPSSTGRGRR